jgi:hypothetical protein
MHSVIELAPRKHTRRRLSGLGRDPPGLRTDCIEKLYADLEAPGRQSQ